MLTLAAAVTSATPPTPLIDWVALLKIILATSIFGAGLVGVYSLGLVLLSASGVRRATSPSVSALMKLSAYLAFGLGLCAIAYGVHILLAK
ncbi:MAG: hypothetical protein NT160_04060 [Actinobacteria bacterium]|nr:hypothetical protein [Actinomycetota bacterium]